MIAPNFNTPQRQSAKGIVVIFGYSIYKVIRASIIVIAAFFLKYFQGDNKFDFTSYKFVIPVVGFLLFFLTLAILKYLNFLFYVNDSYFILKKGILKKEEISVSKTKIQNVYIKQNLLQQIINVVSLSIETAGDDKTEIEIKALKKPEALALKQMLLAGEKEASENETDNTEETPVFFKPSIKHLLLEGISENHLKSFVVIFAFIMTTYNDLTDAISNLDLGTKFNSYFELDNQSLASFLIFNLFIVVVLVVISFLFSLVKTLVQNFDLTVLKTKDGFEISKGLFNKTNLSLKTTRIQTATIKTNRLKKFFGLFQMVFTQAMVNKKERHKFNIIGLDKIKVNALIEEFFPTALNNTNRIKPNKYMIYKVLYVSIIPVLIINAIIFLSESSLFYFLNIPLAIFIILLAIYKYKKAYYSIDDRYIIIGSGGIIDTATSFMEIHKTQAVTIKQTIFQKRRHIASLKIATASKSLKIAHVDLYMAKNIKNYLLFKVETEDRDWM